MLHGNMRKPSGNRLLAMPNLRATVAIGSRTLCGLDYISSQMGLFRLSKYTSLYNKYNFESNILPE